jgi:hypothetical protein
MQRIKLMSLERKWDMEGKTPLQKARLRYYYRNRQRILSTYKSVRGGRDVWGTWEIERQCTTVEY